MEDLESKILKKYKAREKKFQKPKMKISGKRIFDLQKLIINRTKEK